MKPLVTCIIPTRNGERFLGAAIESLLQQQWEPIEVLVVDDGSTDLSAEIAAAFGEPVRVVSHPVANPVLARNHGLGLATGEFFGLLDHNDLWAPDKLALQMAAFEEDPGLDRLRRHGPALRPGLPTG